MIRALVLSVLLAAPAVAQTIDPSVLGQALGATRPTGPEVTTGSQATLRALDKVSGLLSDLEIAVGATQPYQRLAVELLACRFPTENTASDAFAFLRITDPARRETLFQGWMIASSPGLNALDHPRYDIWVLSCR